ncbi:SDR family oxidoreductase [Aureivirga sp. CE67]|uniref:SDR family oxidoreductase n=1 Tax=Aureivirga sp. CE67 TaxID=1788983 RepID=UPI0018CBC432|nr:SDR family oxidoreductase [Aureivirga sp. CE67]
MELKGAKILVTGGSSGIGKETAKLLIEKGAKVLITGRDISKLKSVAQNIGAIALDFDISKTETIEAKTKEAIQLLGGIDVLVNNAGIGGDFTTLDEVTAEDFQNVFTTNVFNLALLTKEVSSYFKEQMNGTIINIGSTASLKGFARGTVYAGSKFALRGMTQCWQAELRKFNVRVTLVCPSEVTTAFGNEERKERKEESNKLNSYDIADTIVHVIEKRDRGFVPEVTVWATNPF